MNTNGTDHRTDKFLAGLGQGQKGLVARRGQPFRLRVSFNRMLSLENRDSIALVFTLSGMLDIVVRVGVFSQGRDLLESIVVL